MVAIYIKNSFFKKILLFLNHQRPKKIRTVNWARYSSCNLASVPSTDQPTDTGLMTIIDLALCCVGPGSPLRLP